MRAGYKSVSAPLNSRDALPNGTCPRIRSAGCSGRAGPPGAGRGGEVRRLTRAAALAGAAALALSACGTAADNDGDGEDTNAQECEVTQIEGDPKVALAYDVGGRGDQSFNDAAYAGFEQAQTEFGFEGTEGEASSDESEEVREQRLRGFAGDGYNVIVGVGFAYSESVDKVAPDYPNVAFAVIDGFDPTEDEQNCNVAYLTFAENEGSFLVGVAAAEQTESNTVGFVGGVNNTLIQKFEAGFAAGVEAVNPDVEVVSTYIEETDPRGFGDPAGGQAAAEGLINDGADVIFHAAGASGIGVFDAVTSADLWAIGVDSDQYLTASPEQQPHILTSMLKRVDVATYDFIKSAVDGEPLSSYSLFTLADEGVGYSTSGDLLSEEIIATIEDYEQQIIDGEIEVPEQP
ncbi:BMP family ABC transporter substrate-binding protein [Aeromicrobium phragmitis]|uniref:BMP family ABC transporter substrate-binding protein n=1 Tax=Aeromicrobium phragmitis TaxID=2478914 RepID=A0A3L8PJV0_9ACTN|nr:BMP family ABC transporter substrate-binding protein [Aeromicrobium phragmitis]